VSHAGEIIKSGAFGKLADVIYKLAGQQEQRWPGRPRWSGEEGNTIELARRLGITQYGIRFMKACDGQVTKSWPGQLRTLTTIRSVASRKS
jgi:hypothetical protein